MTLTTRTGEPPSRHQPRLSQRLLPLYVATALQGFLLWPPIEKLFMTEIGFDAAAVGVMAAIYAVAVPLVEVPSGVLADRWSRRGVLIIASLALACCALIGGLSENVVTYILSAVILAVFFAMHSGTLDAVVYDTVLEETGGSDDFERRLGRVRLIESIALASSSLLGGWVASLTSTRLTYFLTVPFGLMSVAAYLRFREPVLHRAGSRTSLRHHLGLTYQALYSKRPLLPILGLTVLTTLLLQLLIDFGPLWLVATAAPAVLYGPYWAGLMSASGLAGLVAGQQPLSRLKIGIPVAAGMILTTLALTAWANMAVLIAAQITLALLLTLATIHVTRLLHDAVSSDIRSGVASAAGALSWMAFVPTALAIGLVSDRNDIYRAGWMMTALTFLIAILLISLIAPQRLRTQRLRRFMRSP